MTKSLSSADVRKRWSEVIDIVWTEPVEITVHGRAKAVLVGPALFERAMRALEDAEDIAEGRAALEDGADAIPWEDVQRDLGLLT
jgi:prevent-host-death family protein